MEFVDSLPGGRVVLPLVEADGSLELLVTRGHVSTQARDEMVAGLQHIVRHGLWGQNGRPRTD
ncbi:hypothetical protein [Streptomyces sp. NPDC006285]|uniref:hypothetical protein n=1 Tax=Streptomyces sp. NPDC006285 TaxID=3364742 RepID=UPI0036C5628E